MKGPIKMTVTHETVIAALQMYFDSRFIEGKIPVVTGVSLQNVGYQPTEFIVSAEGEKIEAKK